MKVYMVCFSEDVTRTCVDSSGVTVSETGSVFELYSLSAAKRLIKANIGVYVGSSIMQVYSSGEWVMHGEIALGGSNKTFTANTRQRVSSY